MRSAPLQISLALSFSLACADEPWPRPEPVVVERFTTEFNEWREYRRSRLVVPGSGPVTWIGLWELGDGSAAFGADSTLPIVLPRSDSPALAGTLQRSGAEVRFQPAAGADVRLPEGATVSAPLVLASDRTRSPTVLALGSLRLRIHGEPGTDRLWLRAWDTEHPDRETFRLPESFAPDTVWRVSARLERFGKPREFRVPDVTNGEVAYESPGELVFKVGGREHRLAAFGDSASRNFFVIFWDSTARSVTYQAGRYLSVPAPGPDGWTVIDFNRAYNPPCVFSPFSVCALPPRGNYLRLAVTAGEKRKG